MFKRIVLLIYYIAVVSPAPLKMRPMHKLRQGLCTEADIRYNVKDCEPSVCTIVYDPLAPHDHFYNTGCWAREGLSTPIQPPRPKINFNDSNHKKIELKGKLCTEVEVANKATNCVPSYCITVYDPYKPVLPECHALPTPWHWDPYFSSFYDALITSPMTDHTTDPTLYPPSETTTASLTSTNREHYTHLGTTGNRGPTKSTAAPYNDGGPPTGESAVKCNGLSICKPVFASTDPERYYRHRHIGRLITKM